MSLLYVLEQIWGYITIEIQSPRYPVCDQRRRAGCVDAHILLATLSPYTVEEGKVGEGTKFCPLKHRVQDRDSLTESLDVDIIS